MSRVNVQKAGLMTGHKDCVYALTHSPVSSVFFSGAGDGLVVKWDLSDMERGEVIAQVPNSVYALNYYSPRDLLLVGHNYEGIHFIDWHKKKELASLKCTSGAIFDICSLENLVYIGDSSGTLTVVDAEKLRVVREVKYSDKSLRSISIHRDRGELALGFSDNIIRIVSLDNYEILKELTDHTNSVFTVTYNKETDLLYSAGRDAHLKIWNAASGYEMMEDIVAHMYAINNISFSPDGKHFVTCSMDKSIKVWDSATFRLLKVIDKARHAGHGTSVNNTLWLEEALVSASDDRTISAWDLEFNL